MKLLLLTTCICEENNLNDLTRLSESLKGLGGGASFEHVILLQNSSGYDLANIKSSSDYTVHILEINGVVSLSAARNQMIRYSNEMNLIEQCRFVSFPDDDCWFPANFWSGFVDSVKKYDFDIFYSRYSSSPYLSVVGKNKHSVSNMVRNSSSVTTFYRNDVFKRVGFFDELFGVGALNNGGEDTDFVLRGSFIAKNIYYFDGCAVGHAEAATINKPLYYKGSLGVLSKHKFRSIPVFYNYFRKILVGCFYILLGRLKFSDFKISR